jgi:hypothetical protein
MDEQELSSLLQQEREVRKELERQLAELKDSTLDLGDTGLKALQKEREARKDLERQLAELRGKAQAGDVLASELQLTKAQLQARIEATQKLETDLKFQIEERDRNLQSIQIENQFTKAAAAISLNSKYVQVLLNAHKSDFRFSPDGIVTTNGLTLEQWLQSTRDNFPEFFNAPQISGSGAVQSRSANSKSKFISRDDSKSFLSNLDGIISGEIQTE